VLNHLSHSTLNVEAIRCFGALCLGLGALLWESTELCATGVINQLALTLAAAPAPGTDDQARRRAVSAAAVSPSMSMQPPACWQGALWSG
jgi:hypothetical protein